MNKKTTLPALAKQATIVLLLSLFLTDTGTATANFSLNTILVNGSDNDFSSIAFDAWRSGSNYNTSGSNVGYWAFEEGSGTTTSDATGNANTGTLTLGPTWSEYGAFGKAINLDGSDDYVTIPHNGNLSALPNNNLSFWISPDTYPSAGGLA